MENQEFNEESVKKEFMELTGLEVETIKEDNLSDNNQGNIIWFELETKHKRLKVYTHNDEISRTAEIVKAELRKIGINDYSITALKKRGYENIKKLFEQKIPESLKIGTHEVLNCLYHLIDNKENNRYVQKLKAVWKNKPIEDTEEDYREEYEEYLICKDEEEAEQLARSRVYDDLENEPELFNKDWYNNALKNIDKSDFDNNPECKNVTDILSKQAVDTDGFSHFLAGYDGEYKNTKSGFIVMRTG